MAKDEIIDNHVSLHQCKLAINALHSHESKKQERREENELLPAEAPLVWLNVTVKRMPNDSKIKPIRIPVVHPIVDPRTSPVCLITKDPQREYKDLLEKHNIKFISRVVGIAKLKGKFRSFEARRMLLKENGLFLADDRVIPLLPKLLGAKWFEAKKQPVPVNLARKDLKKELERAISSTYMNQNRGTCMYVITNYCITTYESLSYSAIKIGRLSHSPAQLLDNLKEALPAIIHYIKDGWENVQNLHVKTNSSMSLPIWTCSLDDEKEGRWAGLTMDDEQDEADGSNGVEDSEKSEPEAMVTSPPKTVEIESGKGKKRSPDQKVDEDKPKKRAKKLRAAT
ncbi:hypothetical protein AMATHDRAFT_45069 [Amanita thiersii Skay4041]|uniref:Ribosomal L1 domain-containing protein 1 n=1 Tax=Amanita thiersii Skay4041 TaxID=703135 RepID=A0A2A9NVB2_9AGAR|nr:hypothetical protein AMATHDRAFT_45069 [Amanita thiersii Skay4041]